MNIWAHKQIQTNQTLSMKKRIDMTAKGKAKSARKKIERREEDRGISKAAPRNTYTHSETDNKKRKKYQGQKIATLITA